MKRTLFALTAIFALSANLILPTNLVAADPSDPSKTAGRKSISQILPASTLFYAEISKPSELVNMLLNHPLRMKIEKMEQYKSLLASPQYKQMLAGIKFLESTTKMSLEEIVNTAFGGGIHVAFDAETKGFILLIRSGNEEKLASLKKTVFGFIELAAAAQGNENALKANPYRGFDTYKVPQGGFCVAGPWILFTNNRNLGQVALDNMLDVNSDTLANNKHFKQARAQMATGSKAPAAWAFVRTEALKESGQFVAMFNKKSDNPGLEMIAGGLIEAVKHAPFATASLTVKEDELGLSLATAFDPKDVPVARKFFFSSDSNGSAPVALRPKGTLVTIAGYRDMAGMFRAADELFNETMAAEITKSESQLSTFFGGRDFVDDILGNLKPQVQLIAARQDYGVVTPSIKIPAGAIVVRLKKADELTQAQFKSAFMSLMSIINLDGMNKGRSMLLLDIQKHNGAALYTSKYSVDPETTKKDAGEIHYNFSPTMAIYNDWIIVSSTNQLAKQLVDEAKKSSDKLITDNTRIQLDAKVGHQLLVDNRDQLIAQDMLEKGHSRDNAATEIDLMLAALKYIKTSDLNLSFKDNIAKLSLSIKMDFDQ